MQFTKKRNAGSVMESIEKIKGDDLMDSHLMQLCFDLILGDIYGKKCNFFMLDLVSVW